MPTRLTKAKVPVGTLVTCREAQYAYYHEPNNGAKRPVVEFRPGMVGRVSRVDVPYVREQSKSEKAAGIKRGDSFCCVDFFIEGHRNPHSNNEPTEYRCALNYFNMVIVGETDQRETPINPAELTEADHPKPKPEYVAAMPMHKVHSWS